MTQCMAMAGPSSRNLYMYRVSTRVTEIGYTYRVSTRVMEKEFMYNVIVEIQSKLVQFFKWSVKIN